MARQYCTTVPMYTVLYVSYSTDFVIVLASSTLTYTSTVIVYRCSIYTLPI